MKKIIKKQSKAIKVLKTLSGRYQKALSDIKKLVQQGRSASARSVNAIMTATYWEIGRRIVQVEQKGKQRADYGEELIKKLAKDLTKSLGKGFGERTLERCRQFYLFYSNSKKSSTVLTELIKKQKVPTLSAQSFKLLKTQEILSFNEIFPLPWSAYVQSTK